MVELQEAIRKCKLAKAHGADGVRYELIHELGVENETLLLKFFNNVWLSDTCPNEWKLALLAFLPKAGK